MLKDKWCLHIHLNYSSSLKGINNIHADSRDKNQQILTVEPKWKKCAIQTKSVRKPWQWPHVEGYPHWRTVRQASAAKQTHDCWTVTRYVALLGLFYSYNAFIKQGTRSSCQNSQFPVHLHNQENSAKAQTVTEFAGCKKLTTATLLLNNVRQQPVTFFINRSVWQTQVEEPLTLITVLQSCLNHCKTVIWKTEGRIDLKTKHCIHYCTDHCSKQSFERLFYGFTAFLLIKSGLLYNWQGQNRIKHHYMSL